ncbi:hypothetical protein ABID08_002788 [Rhizobium binae]|uniref:Uncharacterized protein n=1 Tax=Rhizobium binae TaxID=1138190 RepID=A0ABV2MIS2_9HYPH|nr:hypothetical protein [Rhizobium binae]MBX4948664.1 hypothetical protein [Rhizobium binae]MBX4995103.1 hypothetical protein [Rhizobium binae]
MERASAEDAFTSIWRITRSSLTGKPFQCGKASPFISWATSESSSLAFQAGMLL